MAYKQEQFRGDHYVEITFSSCCRLMKYPYTKNNSHDLHIVITHSLVLVIEAGNMKLGLNKSRREVQFRD